MDHALARCAAPGSACRLLHLGAQGARPVWAVLEAASEAQFSGRITLVLPVPIDVHLLRGEVYVAELDTDPDLGDRLVGLGVLDAGQLARGTVRVANTTNVGRLFDRVPELDPHRFEVALQIITDAALAPVNDEIVEHVHVVHRAHHPSGIVRWFGRTGHTVAPVAPVATAPAPPLVEPTRPTEPTEPTWSVEPVPVTEAVQATKHAPVELPHHPVDAIVDPIVAPTPHDDAIADPEPSWLQSLEPVSMVDDPVITVEPATEHDVESTDPAPLLAGRPSIPAPPAAPIHDLMADLDLSSILAKVASPDGPPIGQSSPSAPAWAPTPAGTTLARQQPSPRTAPAAAVDAEIHVAVNQALAGIEAATRRDEVVDQYVNRRAVPAAPAADARPPAFPAEPTLPIAGPRLPVAPATTPAMPLAPPAPAPADPATPAWTEPAPFTSLALHESNPDPSPSGHDEPVRSGGFRRLIGGGGSR